MRLINGSQVYRAFNVNIEKLNFNDTINKRDYKIFLLEAKILRSLLSNFSHMSLKEVRLNIDIMNEALLERATPEVIEYLKKPRALSFKEMNGLLRAPWTVEAKEEQEEIAEVKELLDGRGVISNEAVESAKVLRKALKSALPVINSVPLELEEDFIKALSIEENRALLDTVISSGEGLGFEYTLADLNTWAGAVAWLSSTPQEAESLLIAGSHILQNIRASREVLRDLIAEYLSQYLSEDIESLKEWAHGVVFADDIIPSLDEVLRLYLYEVEGEVPEYLDYAMDAVKQGICGDVLEADYWISNNIIGLYESTTEYAQQVIDSMELPEGAPLKKVEDYWEQELRYDISVLENGSIKSLLVRS